MPILDKDIHKGHRARMRSKLASYGPRIFDTYELLEMLLYYVIPVRDTNPVAKRLLAEFGDLDGVLSASMEELMAVDGIGAAAASYLITVGALPAILPALSFDRQGYRIGYGKGYYDRYLALHPDSLYLVGVCARALLCDSLAHDHYDIPANAVVNEMEVLRIEKL